VLLNSDYGKGVCTQSLLTVLGTRFLAAGVPILVDPTRGRSWPDYGRVTLIRGETLEINQAWLDHQLKDSKRVAVMWERLSSLGWLMKALKEPLARLANKEDDCKGTF